MKIKDFTVVAIDGQVLWNMDHEFFHLITMIKD